MRGDTKNTPHRSRGSGRFANIDLLSDLHKDVLSHILSRLPTKDAVRTSVLSKTWKYKWNHVDIYDYSSCMDRESGPPDYTDKNLKFTSDVSRDNESFGNFLDTVVSFRSNLKSFSVRLYLEYNLSRVTSWLCALLGRDVEMVHVCYWLHFLFLDQGIVLPWRLLDSPSRRILNLTFPCTFNVASHNGFHNLTKFALCGIRILNGEPNSDTFILNFPVLASLELKSCEWVDVKFVKIYAPLLNEFTSMTWGLERLNDYSIQIIGSRLSRFESSGGFPDIFTGSPVVWVSLLNHFRTLNLLETSSLRNVGLQVRKLLNESPSLNLLKLSSSVVKVLLSGPLRPLDKLKRLTLVYPCGTCTEELFKLLHAAPSLNFLSVSMFDLDDYDYDDYDYDAGESVPSCIVSHLKEVKLKGFKDMEPQFKLVKFLLKNCEVLKKLTFVGSSAFEKKIMMKLSTLPIISTGLTFVFT